MTTQRLHISRRQFLATSAAAGASLTAGPAFAANDVTNIVARSGKQKLHNQLPASTLWTYDGAVPGTPLRVKQGAEVAIRLQNKLSQPTSIHWHGVRVPNAMDGVPHLTQAPVAAGGTFDYRFRADDAGTFFYHPHINSTEQMGRGLFGPLIVEEAMPPGMDRDVVWVLNDWRVGRDGRLDNGFNNPHDLSHAGRYGNLVTVNATPDPVLKGRRNERIRLRLINASTGRIFALRFGQMTPWVIALDGHPVTPRRATRNDLLVGPGNRIDLAVDLPDKAGATVHIVDAYYPEQTYRVARLTVGDGKAARPAPLGPPMALAANPIKRFDRKGAKSLDLLFAGGAMGGMMGRGGMMMRRHMQSMMRSRLFWIMNDRLIPPLGSGQSAAPLFQMAKGKSYVIRMENQTAFDHPIHLHGHTFQVLARNGEGLKHLELRDTVMIRPRQRIDIGFVADNPGRWMLHCHILSHVQAGMGGVVTVG